MKENDTRPKTLAVPWWLLVGLGISLISTKPAFSQQDGLIRRTGQHIRLVTDLSSTQQADDIVDAFDAAVPQWIQFWGIPAEAVEDWIVDAYVMRDSQMFRRRGFLPPSIQKFPFGYAAGNRLWIHEQPSEYYTRHLVLHEGVHSLMFGQFGGAGPSWFMEGTAELLSLHDRNGSDVRVNRIPIDRSATPSWGRFKLMAGRREENAIPSIESVMKLPRALKGDVESYGWSWAAVMLLSRYPEYRETLMASARTGRDDSQRFNRQMYRRLESDWPIIQARWTMMNLELDYGFDWSNQAVELSTSEPTFVGNTGLASIQANHGWQSAGFIFPAGTTVRLTAAGEVTLNDSPRPWVSLPEGITIEYVKHRPIGQLIGCILPIDPPTNETIQIPEVFAVGADSMMKVPSESWLMLRVNDTPDGITNNQGEYKLQLSR